MAPSSAAVTWCLLAPTAASWDGHWASRSRWSSNALVTSFQPRRNTPLSLSPSLVRSPRAPTPNRVASHRLLWQSVRRWLRSPLPTRARSWTPKPTWARGCAWAEVFAEARTRWSSRCASTASRALRSQPTARFPSPPVRWSPVRVTTARGWLFAGSFQPVGCEAAATIWTCPPRPCARTSALAAASPGALGQAVRSSCVSPSSCTVAKKSLVMRASLS